MTGAGQRLEVPDCGAEVAAYALGALDPDELEAFRAHLQECVVCAEELAAFERVVEVLSMSAPQHPAPSRLRREIMDTVGREPRTARPVRHRRALSRFSLPRPAVAPGTALAVLAIAVVGVELVRAGASDTRVYPAHMTGGGSASVSVTADRAQLVVHHLPPPPGGQIYEVWLQRLGQAPTPTRALFSTTASGEADVEVPGSIHGVGALMVTREPAGGSRVPTHSAVIRARLS